VSSFRSVLVLLVLAGCQDATGLGERHILWFLSDRQGAIGEPLVDSSLAVFTSFSDMRVIGLDAHSGKLRWQTRLPLAAGVSYAGMPAGGILSAYQDLIIGRKNKYSEIESLKTSVQSINYALAHIKRILGPQRDFGVS